LENGSSWDASCFLTGANFGLVGTGIFFSVGGKPIVAIFCASSYLILASLISCNMYGGISPPGGGKVGTGIVVYLFGACVCGGLVDVTYGLLVVTIGGAAVLLGPGELANMGIDVP
jgi:hypothetical protein